MTEPRTEAQLLASARAHRSWAQTPDRTARTAPARAGLQARFENEVDPDRTLDPAERARRAESARRAYFADLARRSAKARRQAKEAQAELAAVEAEAEGVSS